MDPKQKKIALRMIPYGLYVLTAETDDGQITAGTVNWVTQVSFDPPLIVVGVKRDSRAHEVIKKAGKFALNVPGKEQKPMAFSFFKPPERDGKRIGGEPFHKGSTGAPILESVPAAIECVLTETVEKGDHSIFVGEVADAVVSQAPEGRPDEGTLRLPDLGDNVFYGG